MRARVPQDDEVARATSVDRNKGPSSSRVSDAFFGDTNVREMKWPGAPSSEVAAKDFFGEAAAEARPEEPRGED
jgi:hypothetical protein